MNKTSLDMVPPQYLVHFGQRIEQKVAKDAKKRELICFFALSATKTIIKGF